MGATIAGSKAREMTAWPSGWQPPHAPGARPVAVPRSLRAISPWFPKHADYRWRELSPAAAAAASHVLPGEGGGGERILLAPPWLIAADNSLGHRYKHWQYGARPAPCVMLHFVCVATGEGSRILPMQLFGRWHHRAVEQELGFDGSIRRGDNSSGDPAQRRSLVALPRDRRDDHVARYVGLAAAASMPRRPLIALAGATLEAPLKPRPWPELNALQLLLGGLARLSGRSPALPALDCHGTKDAFLSPGNLPNRCFWHVHAKAGCALPLSTSPPSWPAFTSLLRPPPRQLRLLLRSLRRPLSPHAHPSPLACTHPAALRPAWRASSEWASAPTSSIWPARPIWTRPCAGSAKRAARPCRSCVSTRAQAPRPSEPPSISSCCESTRMPRWYSYNSRCQTSRPRRGAHSMTRLQPPRVPCACAARSSSATRGSRRPCASSKPSARS